MIYDLPASTDHLPEGVDKAAKRGDGSLQGTNDFKQLGYGGPCPPKGSPHRYFFKVYALDAPVDLKSGASKSELEQAMKGHVLAEGQLMGKYSRKR